MTTSPPPHIPPSPFYTTNTGIAHATAANSTTHGSRYHRLHTCFTHAHPCTMTCMDEYTHTYMHTGACARAHTHTPTSTHSPSPPPLAHKHAHAHAYTHYMLAKTHRIIFVCHFPQKKPKIIGSFTKNYLQR